MSLLDKPTAKRSRKITTSTTSGGGGINQQMENIYKTNGTNGQDNEIKENWFKQLPYAFIFTDRSGTSSTFYLPISPSNLNITTHWATNVISTMYGTVEEHSEQRYYDIQISGTTGMSPKFYDIADKNQSIPGTGRAGYPVKGLIPGGAGGFFQRTQDLVASAANSIGDLFGEDKPSTGINLNRTGYAAFHRFYKFLLTYKKDASGESSVIRRKKGHPLKFVNYKDNNEYDVAINGFQLTRDASNPMLYNYNITMRAYNLRTADSTEISFDISDRAAELGLVGIETSLFASMANKARQAKNAAYSAIAAVKGFGS